jgi:hypothetical protein
MELRTIPVTSNPDILGRDILGRDLRRVIIERKTRSYS